MSCLLVTSCQSCPAVNLKNLKNYGHTSKAFPRGTNWEFWVNYCENLRKNECIRILDLHGEIKLYLLTESIPHGRFIYDTDSNYHRHSSIRPGLRTNLCEELIDANCPSNINHCSDCPHLNRLLEYLRRKGILLLIVRTVRCINLENNIV